MTLKIITIGSTIDLLSLCGGKAIISQSEFNYQTAMDLRFALENETVADVGYQPPATVQKDETIQSTVARMRREKYGCILILEGEKFCGIFTERDFLNRVLGKENLNDRPISDVMTSKPTIAIEDIYIHEALNLLHKNGIRHLPLIDDQHRPVGTISVKRAVNFLADYHPTTVYNLPPEPETIPAARDGG
ncbi:MAG: hypothetical protein CMI18_09565 [Opitutaceae bacterium]|nr:hypothetical protein [Opitutaceae bacterium]